MKLKGVKIRTGCLLYIKSRHLDEYHWFLVCKDSNNNWIAIIIDNNENDHFHYLSEIEHDAEWGKHFELYAIYDRSILNKSYFKADLTYRKSLWARPEEKEEKIDYPIYKELADVTYKDLYLQKFPKAKLDKNGIPELCLMTLKEIMDLDLEIGVIWCGEDKCKTCWNRRVTKDEYERNL